jgi:hypothetical protein
VTRQTVVFVLCPGHSGSTLLGHFLGAHPQALHVGEFLAPLRRRRPFVCRVCEDESCPVWGSLLKEEFARAVLRRFERERRRPSVLAALWRLAGGDLRCALHRRVLSGLPETRVLVDSSKAIAWARWNRGGARGLRVVYLHLRRDLRGVLASHLSRPDAESVEAICQNLARLGDRLLEAMAGVDPADAYSLQYEALVASPEETGHKLCAFLGLDFDPAMLEYYKVPQHVIGGNPGPTHQVRAYLGSRSDDLEFLNRTSEENQRFYREGRPGFLRDLRWKKTLTPEQLEIFDRIAGPTNRRLGYGDGP